MRLSAKVEIECNKVKLSAKSEIECKKSEMEFKTAVKWKMIDCSDKQNREQKISERLKLFT